MSPVHKEEKHQQAINEIEQTLTSYLLEMKEENEVFLKQFESLQENESKIKKIPESINSTGEKNNDSPKKDEIISPSIKKATKSLAANRYRSAQSPSIKDEILESDEQKIVRMKNEGMLIPEIAKSLNKGQTEIELMLKFHKKNK